MPKLKTALKDRILSVRADQVYARPITDEELKRKRERRKRIPQLSTRALLRLMHGENEIQAIRTAGRDSFAKDDANAHNIDCMMFYTQRMRDCDCGVRKYDYHSQSRTWTCIQCREEVKPGNMCAHSSTHELHVNLDFSDSSEEKIERHQSGACYTRASDVTVEEPRWMWRNYIPEGEITMLAGDPGIGKSTMALDLVARVTRGTFMPDGLRSFSGTCAVISAEDARAKTVVPRLITANANLKRILLFTHVEEVTAKKRPYSIPQDLPRILDIISDKGIRVLVLDPLNAFLSNSVDTYNDRDMRSVLSPIAEIAQQTGCVILIVAHLNKKEDAATLYRVGGSIGFVAAARSVLAVSQHIDGKKVLYPLKSNLSRNPPAQSFRTVEKRVEGVRNSAVEWLGVTDFDPSRGQSEPDAERECREFLMSVFNGESLLPSEEIREQANKAGVSWSTLKFYKRKLGITAVQRGHKWFWKYEPKRQRTKQRLV